jgi:hypothetical protein
MSRKLFWSISPSQEKDVDEFFIINKINATQSEFVIDSLNMLAKNIDQVLKEQLSTKKITHEEITAQKINYEGKITPKKGYKLKVIILTGSKTFDGLMLACKINNVVNLKNKDVVYSTLDSFVEGYIENELNKISAWLIQYNFDQEAKQSKEETLKEEKLKEKPKSKSS